jgi:glycosyltransferase involved in cell wall biosynthesis
MAVSNRRSILALTSLYPRPERPLFGIFNYHALRELSSLAAVTLISPVSWVDRIRDRRARPAAEAARAAAPPGGPSGAPVPHYRTHFSIPVAGRRLNGYFQYRSILATARRMHQRSAFELILAYWVYPDGYAAHLLSQALGIPYAVVALGSDLNVMGYSKQTRARISRTLSGAACVLNVSAALQSHAVTLGAPRDRCRVVPNGIDPDTFFMTSRGESRSRLALARDERLLLFIGSLHPVKGADLLLEALARTGGARPRTILIGDGGARRALQRRAADLGLADSVDFLGQVPHGEIARYLNAADFLVLPSRFEGCPNVILEALACGTPVIASAVGGIPELVTRPEQGILVEPESPEALARAIEAGFERSWEREAIAHGSGRTWKNVAAETLAIIEECLDTR